MTPQKPDPRYAELARKWLNGTITPAEQQDFADWYNSGQDEPLELPEGFALSAEAHARRMADALERKTAAPVRRLPVWKRAAAAAVLLACLGTGAYFAIRRDPQAAVLTAKNDLQPGAKVAYLTLGDGRRIVLTGRSEGLIAPHITKTADGEVVYEAGNDSAFNSIRTPRGGEYQVILPDGTHVWLNSASSLAYPASFGGQRERKVKLEGEAYFEVAKDRSHPFIVSSRGQEVKVLGTHFNVNAYPDEPASVTTLLEGSVRINDEALLSPGQQAVFAGGAVRVGAADTEHAVAWKNGYFRFNDQPIREVMRTLARWYDIEVEFRGTISREGFNGTVSRYKNISQALAMLQQTGSVRFEVEGRKVLVFSN